MNLRRQFTLLTEDETFLNEYGLPWETIIDGSQWVLIHKFPTHLGYNYPQVSIAVRLERGYPQTPLDMVYVDPWLARQDGKSIGQANVKQPLDGKDWQRWSRHRTSQNPWRFGQDNLETHIYLIQDWFIREFDK